MRAAALLLLFVAGLALPAVAAAQDAGDPLGPLPTAEPTRVPTVVNDVDGDDVDRGTLLIIGGGLLVTFLVIGRVIFRDARQRVPADPHAGQLREQDAHKHAKHAKERARKKTKAQRAARRRNR